MSFAKDMSKNISKNIITNFIHLSYSQKLLDHTKQSAKNALKTVSKTAIQKTTEAIGDLIGNKERHISPEEKQKFINGLLLM